MAQETGVKNTGLRGVKVADTKISFIDGNKGILLYRGYSIEELASNSTYLETAYLILNDRLPSQAELKDFKEKIAIYSILPDYIANSMKTWPKDTLPMQAMITALSMLGFSDKTIDNKNLKEHEERAVRLIAQLPVLVAAWHRIRKGHEPVLFDPSLSFAENFLYQVKGEKPDTEIAKKLDVCLILHAEHTFNASTFACREVVSTQSDMYSGTVAGIAALSGPLHGGANEVVMAMLLELENEPDVEGWVRNRIQQGQRIMGMGHAVYKTRDPRAFILKEMCRTLGEKLGQLKWFQLLERIEKAALQEFETRGKTGIQPNIDFFSAPVYHMFGLPTDLFTPVFAISRMAGWCAHMLEEKFALAQPKPTLYRPSAEYIGNYCGLLGCGYKPVNER